MIDGPDEDLKRKLLEFIGAKLLKAGDSYDRGSALFTKASSLFKDIDSYDGRGEIETLKPRLRSFEPVLKKK